MIRPFTVICCVVAGSSVLYTYQSKHGVQLLDRQIEKTLADTASLREQSRTLKAEFTLRENPERLRTFADQYLSLKPMLPTQFTTFAELDARLPVPRVMAPQTGTTDTTEEPVETPGAAMPSTASVSEDAAVVVEELPIPPLPVAPPPVAVAVNQPPPVPRPAPPRPPAMQAAMSVPAPTPIQAQPIQPQAVRAPAAPMQARPQVVQMPAHVQPQAPAQAQTQAQQPQMPAPQPVQSGSLLGMARGGLPAPVPMPRPMPISSTQWANGN